MWSWAIVGEEEMGDGRPNLVVNNRHNSLFVGNSVFYELLNPFYDVRFFSFIRPLFCLGMTEDKRHQHLVVFGDAHFLQDLWFAAQSADPSHVARCKSQFMRLQEHVLGGKNAVKQVQAGPIAHLFSAQTRISAGAL